VTPEVVVDLDRETLEVQGMPKIDLESSEGQRSCQSWVRAGV